MDSFDAYFKRADLDQDGRISGAEAVAFFQGSNLPKNILAQIWMHADQNRTGYLGRPEFYNALKLVTVAQRGFELKPDIVKATLYSPAAATIPVPQINPVSTPVPQMNSANTHTPQSNTMVTPSSQVGVIGPTASHNLGFRGQQALPNAGANNFMRPAQAIPAVSLPVQGASQGLAGGGSTAGPRLPSSNTPNLSTDWLGAGTSVTSQVPTRGLTPSAGQEGFFGLAQLGTAPRATPKSQTSSESASSFPPKHPSLQPAANDPKALAFSGNGFSSESIFGGDVFSATHAKQNGSEPTFSPSSMPDSSSITSVSAGSQNSIKPDQPDHLQGTPTLPPTGSQLQETQSLVKQNQLDTLQSTSTLAVSYVSVGHVSSVPSQSQLPWPRITQSDIQKYTAVFVEVDKDRDGKITGEEARNLFLSWRLPREVLKQVWDLSDQDNDSMLSLRDFCTALYLMERYREGRPIPAVLPNSLRFDETLLLATSQPSTAYAGPAWHPRPGLFQQGIPGSWPVIPVAGVKPPVQTPIPSQADATVQPVQQQKSKVPVLEKHLVSQLSKEEQSALDSKFQEAENADKKVQELEKEILDSREKMEYYRTKMQELVLYKSKCDNRLNEVVERASADKREVESLANKYEAKYKQVGDVASKLTAEEATFRDIQEKKLELFNAIVKMVQGGNDDASLQVHANQIQSDLNDLVKALNERCKQYGLRAKPTSLIELPYGWQHGIQEGSADWDEEWDKFDEEGFTVVNELTVEVENVVAPAKLNPSLVQSDEISKDDVPPVASSSDISSKIEKPSSNGEPLIGSESASVHGEDESARSPPGSPIGSAVEASQDFHSTQLGMHGSSPHAKESHSDHDGAESTISGEKSADEPSWGTIFDPNDDADSIWGFNTLNVKETDRERSEHNFFGSGDFGLNPSRTDSPSAASVSGKEKKGPFFDSLPSTPRFDSGSPRGFNEGSDDHASDFFSRFNSFRVHDNGPFAQHESGDKFARFDSIRSTVDHNRGFPSFDDADPFGSSGPFKSSESHTPRRGTDHWSAF